MNGMSEYPSSLTVRPEVLISGNRFFVFSVMD
jgi:hypothetical protein